MSTPVNAAVSVGPERIVCLTEETTETLYLLGEDRRIVGISGFTVRPARARREKPRVSAFTSAKIDRILALQPDLVLGFSDLQAEIGDTENKIAAARRYLNNASNEYNTSCEVFPSNIIANLFNFQRRASGVVAREERVAIDAAPAVKF